jgi:hypothetical protein
MRVTASNGSQRHWDACNTAPLRTTVCVEASGVRKRRSGDKKVETKVETKGGDKKGQLALPFFAASLLARAGDEAGITSLLPCR